MGKIHGFIAGWLSWVAVFLLLPLVSTALAQHIQVNRGILLVAVKSNQRVAAMLRYLNEIAAMGRGPYRSAFQARPFGNAITKYCESRRLQPAR